MGKGLSPHQLEILKYLHQIGKYISVTNSDLLENLYSYDKELGKRLPQVDADNKVDQASLSRSLKRLERRGLVYKDDSTVEITDKGVRYLLEKEPE